LIVKKIWSISMLYGDDGDYELAIKCGSNLVRVGSKIFKEE